MALRMQAPHPTLSRPWPWLGLGVVFSVVLGATWIPPRPGKEARWIDPKKAPTLQDLQARVRDAFASLQDLPDDGRPDFLPSVDALQQKILATHSLSELQALVRDVNAMGEEPILLWLCARRPAATDHVVELVVEESKHRSATELEAIVSTILPR